jgi:hypothetical protein
MSIAFEIKLDYNFIASVEASLQNEIDVQNEKRKKKRKKKQENTWQH